MTTETARDARAVTSRGISAYRGYRPPPGMISWALHRVTGLGVLLFLLLHIVDIFIVNYGPDAFNELLFLYRHPVFRIGEIILVAGLYYHAANGVRIILIDFWPQAYRYERQLFYGVIAVFLLGFIPTAILMVRAMLT
ncbi:MAG: succinate dehydrogenase, cytochrome b556 subunit [Thermomicrobium sp.]|mgnify:CR=1 FL=1|nr:succinate dehydrogenase, cytochrome b556 subunit [Thermomicrobium sp.]MDW8006927.1 succinate dehydrogenase, cytochrome b556 subunit [Thermomicrobium sp.]